MFVLVPEPKLKCAMQFYAKVYSLLLAHRPVIVVSFNAKTFIF